MINKNLVMSNEKEIVLELIREGAEENQAIELMDKLDMEISLEMDLITKVENTYLSTMENLMVFKEMYGVNISSGFAPVRLR